MTTTARDPIYAGYRYPAEIISYAVWLYFRFPLSLRMVEEMPAARGISVTHETIRQWGLKFGREFANRIRQRAPCRGDSGASMRSSSASPGRSIGSGVPSTRTGSFSMFSSRAGATRRPPNACSASSSKKQGGPHPIRPGPAAAPQEPALHLVRALQAEQLRAEKGSS